MIPPDSEGGFVKEDTSRMPDRSPAESDAGCREHHEDMRAADLREMEEEAALSLEDLEDNLLLFEDFQDLLNESADGEDTSDEMLWDAALWLRRQGLASWYERFASAATRPWSTPL